MPVGRRARRLPLAAGIAILWYRLYNIDRLINRALVYGVLSVGLGFSYWASVLLLQHLLTPITAGSEVAIAASTLALAAVFQPVRRWVQAGVDKRFYRRKYDASRALATFGAKLRDTLDFDQLIEEVVTLVARTLEPTSAWLWAPAADGGWRARATTVAIAPDDPLFTALHRGATVVELGRLDSESRALATLEQAGAHVAVPLIAQGELVGIIALGPRRSETAYDADDRDLLESLASQVAPALRVAQLVREQEAQARELERMEQELRIARLIQRALLPTEPPRLAGWQLAARYEAAREVGGDFYDFLSLPDGRLGVVVGDVSGKGIPAALVMATTLSILRAAGASAASPCQVLQQVNTQLRERLPANMFVTCQYLVLDAATGVVRYSNAGHVPTLWCQAERAAELVVPGLPLGVVANVTYTELELTLGPTDALLLYSDGVVEARNPAGELFGFERLARLAAMGCDGRDRIATVVAELDRFHGATAPLEDDVTLVVVQREASEPREDLPPSRESVHGSVTLLTLPTV